MKLVIAASTIAAAAALSQGAQAQTPAPAPAPAPAACQGPEYRQFDFWIGVWDVFGPKGAKVGDSRIELFGNGCALLENWSGGSGFSGKSLNMYDAADKQWHQAWVDSSGSRLMLDGGLVDGKMVLAADAADPARPGKMIRQRITWTPNADGSVRQLWESSIDAGKTWTVAFDGKYVKRK
jgi:hypothetical protein